MVARRGNFSFFRYPFLVVLVAFLATATVGISSAAAEEKSLSPRHGADAAFKRVNFDVRFAYDIFLGKIKDKPDELIDVNLWTFVLRADSVDEIDLERRLLVDQNYSPAFISRFDAAVQWKQKLENDDGSRAYTLHKKYEVRTDDIAYDGLSLFLLLQAVGKGYPPALRYYADLNFTSKKPGDSCFAHFSMARLIEGGDIDAAIELGMRYKDGDGVPRDDINALYWLTVAVRKGKINEVIDGLEEVYARISAEDLQMVERYLRSTLYPLCPENK